MGYDSSNIYYPCCQSPCLSLGPFRQVHRQPDRDAESCSQLTEAATLWNQIKMNLFATFSDGRKKFRHRLDVEKYWPDDMNGIPNAQQNAERATQKKTTKAKIHGLQSTRT